MRRIILENCTHGFGVSSDACQALFGDSWLTDPRFGVLHCGIDLTPFKTEIDRYDLRQQLGIPTKAWVIGNVGQFREQKNHRFIVEVAEGVIKLNPNSYFLLVGDGPLSPQIRALVDQKGLSDHFIFTGVRSDVVGLLRAMDVFFFPSLYEGLGLALIEAQATGLHCVVSDLVPKEADVVHELIHRISLQANWTDWVTLLLRAYPSISREECLRKVMSTDFDMSMSARLLCKSYVMT